MRRFKTTVVGAGSVGSTLAQRLVEKELTDVVLIDRVTDRGEGKTLDLLQSAPISIAPAHQKLGDLFFCDLHVFRALEHSKVRKPSGVESGRFRSCCND